MLCSFTSIPLSQIHALYTQSWCCLKAWSPSLPGMLNMMSNLQLPRKEFYFALLVKSNLVDYSRTSHCVHDSPSIAARYWVDGLTTENLMKCTKKILLVGSGSPGTISTTISIPTISATPISRLSDGMG